MRRRPQLLLWREPRAPGEGIDKSGTVATPRVQMPAEPAGSPVRCRSQRLLADDVSTGVQGALDVLEVETVEAEHMHDIGGDRGQVDRMQRRNALFIRDLIAPSRGRRENAKMSAPASTADRRWAAPIIPAPTTTTFGALITCAAQLASISRFSIS